MHTRIVVMFQVFICLFAFGVLPGCGVTRTLVIKSEPTEALVHFDGDEVGPTPLSEKLTWSKEDVHTVTVEAEDYERESRTLLYEDAVSASDPWEFHFLLELLVIRAEIDITANVDAATVKVNDVLIGKTPLRHTFVFTRQNSKSPWNAHLIVVSKEGYRYRPAIVKLLPDVNPLNPPFSHRLMVDSPYVAKKQIDLQSFEPIRFVRTKVRRHFYSGEGFGIEEEIVLSQVGEIEREPKVQSVTKITDYEPSDVFIESRIAVMPDGEHIVYSFPFRRPGSIDEFMNIWLLHGSESTRLTDAERRDLEATVTSDGTWIYFSSNRLDKERLNLWRMRAEGRGGLTKITDSPSSRNDVEPAISPDGLRLAYTSYLIGVKLPHIWVANPDGTLPTQLRIGRSPCWSPDSKKLLFVAPDAAGRDRIWVMKANGSNPTQLTAGDYRDIYPVWTPDGKRIIYCSDQALNEEGMHNFDLWIMNTDGSEKTQLTVNGSYDIRPVISADGRYIYFVSNRGARTEGQQALQIWRIELLE